MRARDVFTPGKFPEITFVSRHLEEKERLLRDAIEAGGLVVSLSGPSKSGKTVFIERTIGKDCLIQVTGAGIDDVDKLWRRVFDITGTPIETSESAGKSFIGNLGGKVGADAGFLIKGKGELSASGSWGTTSDKQETRSIDYLQLFIRDVKDSGFVLFVDDFHYAVDLARVRLAEQIKEATRQGMTILCASVPYHSDDVIRANRDLQGRIVTLDFDYWDQPLLREIAEIGFDRLNVEVDDGLINEFSAEAAGSPQLMQSLCLTLCFEENIYEALETRRRVTYTNDLFQRVCRRTSLMTDYGTTANIMREGPKSRGQHRKSHLLRDGSIEDVYPIVVRAISLDPPQLTFRYPHLTERIQAICRDEGPVGSSLVGACEHMARLANDSANETILEWDSDQDVLDIRDPYLLFYLRWA